MKPVIRTLPRSSRLVVFPMPGRGVVSWGALIPRKPMPAETEQADVALLELLMQESTRTVTKDARRDLAERASSRAGYALDPYYFELSGSSPVPFLKKTVEDAFRGATEPALKADEFAAAQKEQIAVRHEQMVDPDYLADNALPRALFMNDHPYYRKSPEEVARALRQATPRSLRALLSSIAWHGCYVVVAGDIDPDDAARLFGRMIGHLPKAAVTIERADPPSLVMPRDTQTVIRVPEKPNASVTIGGHQIFPTATDDFIALIIATSVFGGRGFTGHLMQTVRERDGLTYGVYATLETATAAVRGTWEVDAIFGKENVAKGIDAIRKELAVFLAKGLTDERIEQHRTELLGRAAIRRATTAGLVASQMKEFMRVGFLADIDARDDAFRRVPTELVREVARATFDIRRSATVVAGSVDNDLSPL